MAHDCDVVEHSGGVRVDNDDFLKDVREEPLVSITPVLSQKLHQLRLVDDVEEGSLIFYFLWDLDHNLVFRARNFVKSRGQGFAEFFDFADVLSELRVAIEELYDVFDLSQVLVLVVFSQDDNLLL